MAHEVYLWKQNFFCFVSKFSKSMYGVSIPYDLYLYHLLVNVNNYFSSGSTFCVTCSTDWATLP
jgi:hypothetical protein